MHQAFPGGSDRMVKNLPAVQETQIWSLGREDGLEEGMATHSSILTWRIPWTEEPGGLQSTGSQRAGQDWATNTFNLCIFYHNFKKKTHIQSSQALQTQAAGRIAPRPRLLFTEPLLCWA